MDNSTNFKANDMADNIATRIFNETWEEFTDELEVEKAIRQYDPETLLRDIIQIVAKSKDDYNKLRLGLDKTLSDIQDERNTLKLAAYAKIYGKVCDFVEEVSDSRTIKHMESL